MEEPVEKTSGVVPSDPEVAERASRRKFTAQCKLGLLGEADRCEAGEIGSPAAPGGAVLLAPDHVEAPARERRSEGPGAGE